MHSIIVIAGPTASGKTNIAIKLAQEINGVIINADSRQVYKEISIGTARPNEEEFKNIPHYLFGYVSVKENYNLYKYQQDVQEVLKAIPKKQVPILVGGTGLYIDSIIYNYQLTASNKNNSILRANLAKLPLEILQQKISSQLLNTLNNSEKNNPRRLIRIIENGKSNFEKGESLPHKYFVINLSQKELEKNVSQRIKNMLKNGLIEENKNIIQNGLNHYPALNSIGYTEFNGYFDNEKTLEQVENEIFQNTKKYIKRQKTWFKRNKEGIWTNDYALILKESQNLLKSV